MNDFYSLSKFSQLSPIFKDSVKNILEAAKKPTLFCYATKSFVPWSSLTAILHRGMIFHEHDQLKFLLLTFLVIQKSLLVSDANKVAKIKNWWWKISKFFQTPNSIFSHSVNRALCKNLICAAFLICWITSGWLSSPINYCYIVNLSFPLKSVNVSFSTNFGFMQGHFLTAYTSSSNFFTGAKREW